MNVLGWEKNIAKLRRNSGLDYISYQTKKEVKGLKVMGPQCNNGCFDRLIIDRASDLMNAYWDLADYNKQNLYINSCINLVP